MAMMVLTCNCQSEYQDRRYGKYKRIFNQMKTSSGAKKFKCTICGKEQYV